MALKEVHQEFGTKILAELKSAINASGPSEVKIKRNSNYSLIVEILVGVIDRGPRLDSEFSSEYENNEIAKEFVKKHEKVKAQVKDIIGQALPEIFHSQSSEITYSEKGHVYLDVTVAIEGLFVKDANGTKIWVDLEGQYTEDEIMVMTPDVERYFPSLEKAREFVKAFAYKDETGMPF